MHNIVSHRAFHIHHQYVYLWLLLASIITFFLIIETIHTKSEAHYGTHRLSTPYVSVYTSHLNVQSLTHKFTFMETLSILLIHFFRTFVSSPTDFWLEFRIAARFPLLALLLLLVMVFLVCSPPIPSMLAVLLRIFSDGGVGFSFNRSVLGVSFSEPFLFTFSFLLLFLFFFGLPAQRAKEIKTKSVNYYVLKVCTQQKNIKKKKKFSVHFLKVYYITRLNLSRKSKKEICVRHLKRTAHEEQWQK